MPRTAGIHPLLDRGRVPFVILIVLLTALCGRWALDSRLEQSNESMNARSPQQQRVYEGFLGAFGSDEVIVVALRDERLLEPSGLARLREVTERIEAIDGVRGVLSLTGAVEIVAGPFGATEVPLVPDGAPPDRAVLERALDRNAELTGLIVSVDRQTAGLLVELDERRGDDAYRARVVDELRVLKRDLAAEQIDAHVTGITVQKHDTTRFVARDQRVVLPASVLVLAFVLALITRRPSGVVLPLGVTGVALVWTIGIHAALGFQLNVITSLLPPVVMVLSIATSIHLYQEWIALGPHEPDPRRLAVAVVRSLASPCVWTALTTAMGLASLSVSDVPAVREFALFGALGVLISLALNLTLLPLVLSWLRPPRRRVDQDSRLGPLLGRIADLTATRPRTILAVTAAISLVALAGITRVRNNTDLLRFLHPDAELVRDTAWVDRELVGTNALELLVQRTDGTPMTRPEDMTRIAALVERVAGLDAVTNVLCITGLLARVHQAELDLPEPTLPRQADELVYAFDLLEESERAEQVRRLITADQLRARIAVRVRSIGTAEAQGVIDRIDALARETLGPSFTAEPTGSFYMITIDSNRLVANLLTSFALALGMVFLALAAVFRSGAMLIAALAPNVMPIVWCGGLMGWLGIDLSTATAMVASVAIGIAVDDTIHYLARFRLEHRGDVAAAVRATTRSTGRVLVIASTVLVLGFWVGALGSFLPTVWFSLLTGGAILTALVCDLLVLPACLVLARPRPRRIDP